MSLDPRTPVVVGVGSVTQRADDPRELGEALDLMTLSTFQAIEDAGRPDLGTRIDSIWIPRGFWTYSNPGAILARRLAASNPDCIVAEIGILQSSLLGRAAQALAEGRSEIAVVVGGESRDRDVRLHRQGLDVPTTLQTGSAPTHTLRPTAEIMSPFEIELGLVAPVIQYAMIDNALRHREGQSISAHRAELGALWGDFNRVATENPKAWNREPMTPEAIVSPSESNRMLAYPYTKSLVAQWNVNQAASLILCTLERARSLGLQEDRFIYPLAVVDAEHMLPLSERRDLHRSPGFRHAGARALEEIDRTIDDIEHLELYSCFPAAVRVQQRELSIEPTRRVTQTGGMSFAGGPLNNFVLQSWVEMIDALRADPGAMGLVTAVSGLLTKQGVSLFGPEPSTPFRFDSVTRAARADQPTIDVNADAEGRARIASYTVIRDRKGANRVALICDFEQTHRTLRVVEDPDLAEEAMSSELCGREVVLDTGDRLRWV